ncbi:MAG: helix-turn-helix domain-containing protein [Syntrophaceae bacterium]|nr:helix-turn-helix domain-containing protein [Syntrophaceae bacterium]
MADEIMTVKQLAEYLKLNYQTIYKKIQKGEIPGSKIGRGWRFQKVVIDRWLTEEKAVIKIKGNQPSLF